MMSPGAIHCSKPSNLRSLVCRRPSPLETGVFPMQLQVGDKFRDESGEWEVIAHPYATGGGKSTNVRVQRVDTPGVTEARTRGS
jgi:hypothetical protein